MKTITVAVIGVIVMYGVVYFSYQSDMPTVYNEAPVEVEPLEVIPEDTIEKARKELERINAELDEEEKRLKAEIAERQARIEKIKETRAGFW